MFVTGGQSVNRSNARENIHIAPPSLLYASSSDTSSEAKTKTKSKQESEKKKNVPFFASTLGGGVGTFFASSPASKKAAPSEGKAASITTRLPLGTLFDSREYTFETLTNVRSVINNY